MFFGLVAGTLLRFFKVAAGLALATALTMAIAPSIARAASYSAILLDAGTGEVLYAENSDAPRYPASLAKMMTLYMVFDALQDGRLKLEQSLVVSARAANQAPSVIGLREGDRITVTDAIAAAVTKSANDAAVVLGEAISGNENAFAQAMTMQAQQLGMPNSTFRNASGLPHPAQRTTARDMAALAMALVRDHRQYYGYFQTPEFTWKQRSHPNHNRLLDGYEGADGIKTGYIRASGFNLVASAERDGRRLIGVVFGGTSPLQRDRRMTELLDRGFASALAKTTVVAQIEPVNIDTSNKSLGGLNLISRAEAAAPALSATSWAVQIGQYPKRATAERQALAATSLQVLRDRPTMVTAMKDGRRTRYRALVVGMAEGEARAACHDLKRHKRSCAVVSPSGNAS